ncbi:MAG: DinB family protein [Gemmatimonadales bacterium]
MSVLNNPATGAAAHADAYTRAILDALGTRDPLAVLRETPARLRELTAGLSPEALSRPEAPGKWSIAGVVQHLADSELVGGFRYRMVLAHDAPEIMGFDQDLWAERLRYRDSDLEDALTDFTALRRYNLRLLTRATPEEMKRVMHHVERGEESLAHMMRMYAGHDLVHLRQVERVRKEVRSEK